MAHANDGMIAFLDDKDAGVTGADVGYTGIYVSSAGGNSMFLGGGSEPPKIGVRVRVCPTSRGGPSRKTR